MGFLYADENFDYPVVDQLRLLGHDVLTAQEAGQAQQGIPDADVLAFVIGQARSVVTFNRRHFIRLHGRVVSHCGIIVCTKDDDSAALAARIDQAILSVATLDNQLLRVTRPAP